MQETILVVGGAGYIGSHTAWLLARNGYRIVILDNAFHDIKTLQTFAECVFGDYGDPLLLSKLFKEYTFTAVMHFASFTVVSESVQHPLHYYANNVSKTVILLDSMVKHNVLTLIFSSSCAVYGIPEYLPLTENHPCNPISPYGTTKYMIELMLKDCAVAYGLRYVALRYFNAAGALSKEGLGERHQPETHSIPLLLKAAQTGKPFYIFGSDYPTKDGTCIRDYIHVYDIAVAHYQALLHMLKHDYPSDIFNIGTGHGYSVKEVIDVVQKVTHKALNLIPAPKRPGDPAMLVADPSKAINFLRWKPIASDLFSIVKSAWLFEQQ